MWHDGMPGRGHAGEEKKGIWHDGVQGRGHAGEEKKGIWHDGVPGRGHAGERKVAYGMTGLLEEVMPEGEKWRMA